MYLVCHAQIDHRDGHKISVGSDRSCRPGGARAAVVRWPEVRRCPRFVIVVRIRGIKRMPLCVCCCDARSVRKQQIKILYLYLYLQGRASSSAGNPQQYEYLYSVYLHSRSVVSVANCRGEAHESILLGDTPTKHIEMYAIAPQRVSFKFQCHPSAYNHSFVCIRVKWSNNPRSTAICVEYCCCTRSRLCSKGYLCG